MWSGARKRTWLHWNGQQIILVETQSFWKSWMPSLGRWAGPGCSGQEQGLYVLHRDGAAEEFQAQGIGQTVLQVSLRQKN